MSRTVLDYERVTDGSTEIFDAVTGRVLVCLPASLSFIAPPVWHVWRVTSLLMRGVRESRYAE
jgi:hypothetical protein